MLLHRGAWSDERYLAAKSEAMRLDGRRTSYEWHRRDIMPKCVLSLYGGENSLGVKKKKKSKRSRSGSATNRYGWRPSGNPNLGFWHSSLSNYDDNHWPSSSSQVLDLDSSSSSDDEFGHDDLDDEVLIVPFGSQNAFSMPVDLTLWGLPEKKIASISKLRSHGFSMKEAPDVQLGTSVALGAGPSFGISVPTRRVFLSPSEVKNELDKLFENIQEGDKTTEAEPAKAIGAHMYSHQKQALNWMIERENGNQLPPFWEAKNGGYFNSVTVFTSKNKPKSVRGDGEPLAVPVPGKIRHSKQVRDKQKAMTPQKLKRKTLRDIGNPKNVESSPLPTLPEDEDSTDTDDDSDTEQKRRSRLCPDLKDCKPLQEKESPCRSKRRPRRSVKKPARYTFSSESELDGIESPVKKAKVLLSVKGEEQVAVVGKGKGKGKVKGKQLHTKAIIAENEVFTDKKNVNFTNESNKANSDGTLVSNCVVIGGIEKKNNMKTPEQVEESIVELEPVKGNGASTPDTENIACEFDDELLDPAVEKMESNVSPVKANLTSIMYTD
ncbi:hypothetical protein KUTeg_013237, partial [Tegillarca granosa]